MVSQQFIPWNMKLKYLNLISKHLSQVTMTQTPQRTDGWDSDSSDPPCVIPQTMIYEGRIPFTRSDVKKPFLSFTGNISKEKEVQLLFGLKASVNWTSLAASSNQHYGPCFSVYAVYENMMHVNSAEIAAPPAHQRCRRRKKLLYTLARIP